MQGFPAALNPSLSSELTRCLPYDRGLGGAQIDHLFTFTRETIPHLLTPDVREDTEFLNGKAANEMLHALCYYQEMVLRLNANPNYSSFAHPNLNIDNAWWWTGDGSGEVSGASHLAGGGGVPGCARQSSQPPREEPGECPGLQHLRYTA